MMRVYGLDIEHELHEHRIPPTRLGRLAANLPDGSMVWRRLDTANAWTVDQYLEALLVDQMNAWMWANSDPKRRGRAPQPIPRPGTRNRDNGTRRSEGTKARRIDVKAMSVDELDRFMRRRFTTVERR